METFSSSPLHALSLALLSSPPFVLHAIARVLAVPRILIRYQEISLFDSVEKL